MIRLLLGTVILAALAGFAPSAVAADAAIHFLQPKDKITVLGQTPIKLYVRDSDSATAVRVEISVDGKPLAILKAPPWELTWDAGDGSVGHLLEAVLYLSDGSRTTSRIRISPLQVNQVENVDLVNLYMVVRTFGGEYVTELSRKHFSILEDGAAQTIERFTTTHKPLRVAVVIDSSRSMSKEDRLEKSKRAALEFLQLIDDGNDEAAVVSFSDQVEVLQGFSADRRMLGQAIEQIELANGTALYDAIWRTSRLLDGFDGRRVMVLLSDGQDEAANGLERGSLHTREEALDRALRSEVMIFPIGLGRKLKETYVRSWASGSAGRPTRTTQAELLRQLADATGGRAVMSNSTGQLRKAFEDVAADLRHQYSIAYSSTHLRRDGRWRKIEVRTPGRELEVITRKGYYAPRSR